MGIVNSDVFQEVGRVSHLITPHGDRKHGDDVGNLSASIRSLPLMGIVNVPGLLSKASDPFRLITPHGDRKPSWKGVPSESGWLITPHGDRKP